MGMMTLGLEIGCLIPVALLLVAMPQRLYVLAAGVQTPVGWQVLNAVTSLGSGVVVVAAANGTPLLIVMPAAVAACACGTIIYSDVRYFLIPDLCSLVVFAAGIVSAVTTGPLQAAAGSAVGGLMLLLVVYIGHLRGIEGMGFGDVKLGFALGALLGPVAMAWALCLSSFAGLAWAFLAYVGRRQQFNVIPYGAALGAVAIVMLSAKVAGVSVEPSWL